MHDPALKNKKLAERYSIDRQIGEGGMGAVYVAFDEKTKKRVAVKVLIVEGDEKLGARFEQEARATMELVHPNIVRVTDFHAPAGEAPFLVMELLEGESLRQRMKREKQMAVKDTVRIAIELLQALAVAHAAGVIHRDVKPPNVFLTKPDGRVKLLDFGIAKVRAEFGKVQTTTGTVLGTPSYFAPEQLLAREIDGRTDVHAVGIVLYEMLTARRPWMEENPVDLTAAILHAAPPPIEKLRPDVPPDLAKAIADALAKDRLARPTAVELAKRLAPFADRPRRLAPFFLVAVAGAAGAAAFAYATEDVPVVVPSNVIVAVPTADAARAATADAVIGVEAAAPSKTDDDLARSRSSKARIAGMNGRHEEVRALLEAHVFAGSAEPEDARLVLKACQAMKDRGCTTRVRDLYPSGAGAGDGHLADADGGSGGGGSEVEIRPDGVDALP